MTTEQGKKKFKFPTAFTILVLITVVVAILTRVIPAGRYDYDENGEPLPGTYHPVEANRATGVPRLPRPSTACTASRMPTGIINIYNSGDLYGAIDVALFILLIGGFLGVTMKTGAIDAGINAVVKKLGQKAGS